jgi:hypothetical protein
VREVTKQADVDSDRALQNMWLWPYGIPKRIKADAEYDTTDFMSYCSSIDCELLIIATEVHHQNGFIDA